MLTLKGQTYRPTETDSSKLLPANQANEPFVFVHYPAGWTHEDGVGWLPKPAKLNAKPAVNNIGRDRKIGPALAIVNDKGGLVISSTDPRLGEFVDYVVAYDCHGGGKAYACKWQEVSMLGGGMVHWDKTPAPWLAFRKHLLESGIVPAMERPFLSRAVAQIEERIGRIVARNSEKLGAAENLAKARAKRDAMIADYERQFGAAKPVTPAPLAEAPKKTKITPKPDNSMEAA